jgi:2-dehydro-3-deoxygalactonokinase
MPSSVRVLCDWGSTRLRALLEVDDSIIDRRDGPGIGALAGQAPRDVLFSTMEPWVAARGVRNLYLCGMVGSRNGVIEVPYVPAPTDVRAWAQRSRRSQVAQLELTIAPGVEARNFSGVADVMRGEETQVFGAFALNPALARGRCILVLPGTHSKWVEVQDGEILRFHTFITGELFAVLVKHSSLLRVADSVAEAGDGFESGLHRAAEQDLSSALFETRSAQLVLGQTDGWARAFLSGLLIGSEVGSVQRMSVVAAGSAVTMIGDPALASLYAQALRARNISVQTLDGERCAIEGLRLLSQLAVGGR